MSFNECDAELMAGYGSNAQPTDYESGGLPSTNAKAYAIYTLILILMMWSLFYFSDRGDLCAFTLFISLYLNRTFLLRLEK